MKDRLKILLMFLSFPVIIISLPIAALFYKEKKTKQNIPLPDQRGNIYGGYNTYKEKE